MAPKEQPTKPPEVWISHLESQLRDFTSDKTSWQCPGFNQKGEHCGHLNVMYPERHPERKPRATTLLKVLQDRQSGVIVDRALRKENSRRFNDLVDLMVCGQHSELVKMAMEVVENVSLSSLTSVATMDPSLEDNSSSHELSPKANELQTPIKSERQHSSPELMTHSPIITSKPINSSKAKTYLTSSVTPVRPAPTTIQTVPAPPRFGLSPAESFDSSPASSGTPSSIFSTDGLDPFTPLTPYSVASAASNNKPRPVPNHENQASPTLRRSARIRAQSEKKAEQLQNSIPQGDLDAESAEETEVGHRTRQALFRGSNTKKQNISDDLDRNTGELGAKLQFGLGSDKPTVKQEINKLNLAKSWQPPVAAETRGVAIEHRASVTSSEDDPSSFVFGGLDTKTGHEATGSLITNSNHGETQSTDKPSRIHIEPYKTNHLTDPATIMEAIGKDLKGHDDKLGKIYVVHHPGYVHQSSESQLQLFKVGFTTESFKARYAKDKCKEIPNHAVKLFESDKAFKHAYRVERLVQVYLIRERQWLLGCPSCGGKHKEWFLSTKETVMGAVEMFTRLILNGRLYENGKLSPEAQRFFMTELGSQRIMANLEVYLNKTTEQQTLFVNKTLPPMADKHVMVPIPTTLKWVSKEDSSEGNLVTRQDAQETVIDKENPAMPGAFPETEEFESEEKSKVVDSQLPSDEKSGMRKTLTRHWDAITDYVKPKSKAKPLKESTERVALAQAERQAVADADRKKEPKLGLLRRKTEELLKSKR